MKVQLENSVLNYVELLPERVRDNNTILLFLHEALGSIGQWKSFPLELCELLELPGIIYERQGHGDSSSFTEKRSADYLHQYAYIELEQFIENVLSPKQKVILVGHSDGGTIALLFANRFPHKVHSVVTMAAHVINEPETIAGIAPAIEAFKSGKLDGLKKYHGDKTEDLFYAWANIWRDESFRDWNIASEIGSSHSYLSMQGADDQYGTIEQLNIIKKHTRAEILEIENCGHHPHLEQRDIVINTIKKWLVI